MYEALHHTHQHSASLQLQGLGFRVRGLCMKLCITLTIMAQACSCRVWVLGFMYEALRHTHQHGASLQLGGVVGAGAPAAPQRVRVAGPQLRHQRPLVLGGQLRDVQPRARAGIVCCRRRARPWEEHDSRQLPDAVLVLPKVEVLQGFRVQGLMRAPQLLSSLCSGSEMSPIPLD